MISGGMKLIRSPNGAQIQTAIVGKVLNQLTHFLRGVKRLACLGVFHQLKTAEQSDTTDFGN